MKPHVLSPSLQDYVKAVAEITAGGEPARCKEVAARLRVKMPSVTTAMRALARRGLVAYRTNRPVELTDQGHRVARELMRRHRVMERYYRDVMGLPPDKADAYACASEHGLAEEIVTRLILLSDAILERADTAGLRAFLAEAAELLGQDDGHAYCVVASLEENEAATIHRFGRNLAEPERLARDGLTPGLALRFGGFAPDRARCRLLAGGREFWLAAADAENLWVRRRDVCDTTRLFRRDTAPKPR